MLAYEHEAIAERLRSIPYASVMNVVLAYREQDVGVSLNASGFVVPRKEERKITACTWTSCKWEHTAPEGHILLRAYVGKYGRDPMSHQLTDEEIVAEVRRELQDTMGISSEPVLQRSTDYHSPCPNIKSGISNESQRLRRCLLMLCRGFMLVAEDIEDWRTGLYLSR